MLRTLALALALLIPTQGIAAPTVEYEVKDFKVVLYPDKQCASFKVAAAMKKFKVPMSIMDMHEATATFKGKAEKACFATDTVDVVVIGESARAATIPADLFQLQVDKQRKM